MTEKFLVIGATGFLGANLVRKLVEKGKEVRAMIYAETHHPFLEGLPIEKVDGDILDKDSLKRAMEKCGRVFNVSGLVSYCKCDLKKMLQLHVEGTRNVLESALEIGVKRIIHTSSCAAVGFGYKAVMYDENSPWKRRHDKVGYMYTKRLGEEEALRANKNGLEVISVCPSTLIGAGDINMSDGAVFKNIKSGKIKRAFPGGTSIIAIEDAAEALLLSMEKGKPGERYILSTAHLPLIDFFNLIVKELGMEEIKKEWAFPNILWMYPLAYAWEKACAAIGVRTKITPQAAAIGYGYRYYSPQKARRELGWKPKIDIRQAVREAIEFYEKANLI